MTFLVLGKEFESSGSFKIFLNLFTSIVTSENSEPQITQDKSNSGKEQMKTSDI